MSLRRDNTTLRRRRLDAEIGRIERDGPFRLALAYPSPYAIGMSSLGYQTIYRLVQSSECWSAHRFFLPETGQTEPEAYLAYESSRPLSDFPVVAFSVAYELELAGLLQMLEAARIPLCRSERSLAHPLVVAGGPLTFANPDPLRPFVDLLVLGEAEELMPWLLARITDVRSREALLDELALHPNLVVPSRPDQETKVAARVGVEHLPATSVIRTPLAELSNMVLIEAERGCSRSCGYCVMSRHNLGGMRLCDVERICAAIPEDAHRVGLVGAGVSDHPRIAELVRRLADRGLSVGLSSLRPDRLSEALVEALVDSGCRTLTTALDGSSQRLRERLDRRCTADHFLDAARLCRRLELQRLKLYLMLGLPEETDADLDECAVLLEELSRITPLSVGISPFCAKRHTPFEGTPYAGITTIKKRLDRLRRALHGRVEIGATSPKWGWVERVLSGGGEAEGLAVMDAVRRGGDFAAYRRAFEALGHRGG